MTTRREWLIAFGASPFLALISSFAQSQGKVWRVGWLSSGKPLSSLSSSVNGTAFLKGMRELGYIEGTNLVIERRYADSSYERLPGLAAELVQLKVDVIVAGGIQASSAAKKTTNTTPIVMANVADPVGSGLVQSLARPGGNVTGLTNISRELAPKQLELLLGLMPRLSSVGFLANPANSFHATVLDQIRTAALRLSVKVLPLEARVSGEIESAFGAMRRQNVAAVIVQTDPFLIQQYGQIAELALKNELPSAAGFEEYPEAGGLLSYGQNQADQNRRMATFVDKIFKGAKPADLPVEQPTKFDLVINGKTAKRIGLTIPQSLLISADRVIE